ncbi:hypothetical protein D3C78_1811090 [compost metagenome]
MRRLLSNCLIRSEISFSLELDKRKTAFKELSIKFPSTTAKISVSKLIFSGRKDLTFKVIPLLSAIDFFSFRR